MATTLDRPTALDALSRILGDEHLLTGDEDRRFYSTDVHMEGALPSAVARPGTVAELQALVRACYESGTPVIVRGGGASYTSGYLHDREGGITVDTARLDRIEIDETNGFVTVEAGCSWAKLYETLKARGLRTPFWGPFSGFAATVGGSTSQNAVSHGTGQHGTSAANILSFDIITGTGELLRTGSGGSANGVPNFRYYGPDLAGLFTGDCGALGVKARITLPLMKRQAAFDGVSFAFESFEAMHAAMRAIAMERLDDEGFGLDSALQQGQIGKQEGVAAKAEIARSVLRNAGSLGKGVKALAKMAAAGDRALRAAPFVAHYIVDGVDDAEVRAKAAVIRSLGQAHGEEIANTVPTVVYGMPFAPLTNTLGPKGERWVPLHGLLPHDQAVPFHKALRAYWDANRAELDAHGIWNGAMFCTVGTSAFLYEPTFYWPDAQSAYHQRVIDADARRAMPAYPAKAGAKAVVNRLKQGVIDLMHQHGASHLQVGRAYPYTRDRNPASLALVRAIKAELDPKGILNPGVLGL